MGLDPATVRSISSLLHRLAQKSSPRLVLALRPQDSVPEWITHMLVVGNFHHIVQQGPRDVIQHRLGIWQRIAMGEGFQSMNRSDKPIYRETQAALKAGILDNQLLRDLTLHHTAKPIAEYNDSSLNSEVLIEMDGVRVQYGDKVVLGDWSQHVDSEMKEGLHWRVRRGQRWAILGANGSGKTTLLSLITSDHPQTYALPIRMFGRSRLPEAGKPGISIFELQSRLGHSSPEIHAFFPRQLTVRESLESAFAETFLSKPKLDVERDTDVTAALRFFKAELDPNAGITEKSEPHQKPKAGFNIFPTLPSVRDSEVTPPLSDFDVEYADQIRFGQLTTAQQRIVLFLRALIHKPDIVILDEPFSGLSASQRDKCLQYLERGDAGPGDNSELARFHGLSQEQALVLISHVKEEIPDSVRYYMRLPSDSNDGSEPLDFQFGLLNKTSTLSDPQVWDVAWSPLSKSAKDKRRIYNREDVVNDISAYAWYSL